MGLAQLAKLDQMIVRMRRNSGRILAGIKDIDLFVPREIPDPDGHIGNGVTLIMNDAGLAERFFKKMVERGVEMEWLKQSGWHNYNNWKQLLRKKTINSDGCPFTCPRYKGKVEYYEGMCPQTDDILARAVTIRYNATLHMVDDDIKQVIKDVREVCDALTKRPNYRRAIYNEVMHGQQTNGNGHRRTSR